MAGMEAVSPAFQRPPVERYSRRFKLLETYPLIEPTISSEGNIPPMDWPSPPFYSSNL